MSGSLMQQPMPPQGMPPQGMPLQGAMPQPTQHGMQGGMMQGRPMPPGLSMQGMQPQGPGPQAPPQLSAPARPLMPTSVAMMGGIPGNPVSSPGGAQAAAGRSIPIAQNLAMFGKAGQLSPAQHGSQNPSGSLKLTPAELARLGRYGDTIIAHLTPGEIAIPPQVQTPQLNAMLAQAFAQKHVDIAQFTAGSPKSSINPQTGTPEYNFFSALAGPALSIGGTLLGNLLLPGIGGVIGGALGGGLGGVVSGGDPLLGALLGGAGGGLGWATGATGGLADLLGIGGGAAATGALGAAEGAGASAAGAAAGGALPTTGAEAAANYGSAALAPTAASQAAAAGNALSTPTLGWAGQTGGAAGINPWEAGGASFSGDPWTGTGFRGVTGGGSLAAPPPVDPNINMGMGNGTPFLGVTNNTISPTPAGGSSAASGNFATGAAPASNAMSPGQQALINSATNASNAPISPAEQQWAQSWGPSGGNPSNVSSGIGGWLGNNKWAIPLGIAGLGGLAAMMYNPSSTPTFSSQFTTPATPLGPPTNAMVPQFAGYNPYKAATGQPFNFYPNR